jgi:hypothetical protein
VERGPVLPPGTENESKRLFHELEVHQIELEMQNEELHHVMDELEKSEEKLTALFEIQSGRKFASYPQWQTFNKMMKDNHIVTLAGL